MHKDPGGSLHVADMQAMGGGGVEARDQLNCS